MLMGLPLFLLFSIYGVFNTYLPILLSNLGYSASMIGILQGVFEASGLVFPIFISRKVDRRGNYGQVMILLTVLMLVMLPPLVLFRNFWATAAALALFAIGYKGIVPVSDALVSRILGPDTVHYGRVRVLGSIGFVCITLLLQFTPLVDTGSPMSIMFWIALPSALFMLSLILVPGLLARHPREAAPRDMVAAPVPEPVNPAESSNSPVLSPIPAVAVRGLDGGLSPERPDTGLRKFFRVRALAEFPVSFWIGIALIFLGNLGMTPSQRFLSLYVKDYLHIDAYAGLWALSAASEVPFMFLSGYVIRKYGTEKILVLSLLAISLRHIVYAAFPTFGGAVAGQLFHSVCFGLFHPAAIVFITQRAPKRLMVVAMTLYTSVASGLAAVLGNVIGGFVIDFAGYRALFLSFSALPLVGLLLFWRFRNLLYRRD